MAFAGREPPSVDQLSLCSGGEQSPTVKKLKLKNLPGFRLLEPKSLKISSIFGDIKSSANAKLEKTLKMIKLKFRVHAEIEGPKKRSIF